MKDGHDIAKQIADELEKEIGVCLKGSIHEKNFRYCEHYGHYIQLLIDR